MIVFLVMKDYEMHEELKDVCASEHVAELCKAEWEAVFPAHEFFVRAVKVLETI